MPGAYCRYCDHRGRRTRQTKPRRRLPGRPQPLRTETRNHAMTTTHRRPSAAQLKALAIAAAGRAEYGSEFPDRERRAAARATIEITGAGAAVLAGHR